jgi:lysophospholipase L1-like esterase
MALPQSMSAAIDEIYYSLTEFINQTKMPAKAVLEEKLRQIQRDLAKANDKPMASPVRRAADFGSRKKSTKVDNSAAAAELNLTIATPQKETSRHDESDDSVPDLEQFLVRAPQQKCLSPQLKQPQPRQSDVSAMAAPAPAPEPTTSAQPAAGSKKNHCLIISDSSFRVVSAFLVATHDHHTKTLTNFTCHAIGSATISSLTIAIHEGLPVDTTDHLILHVGVNDVGSPEQPADPQVLKREYQRLLRTAREKFPKPEISLSHVFPVRTADMRVRRNVQMANNAIDAAAAETPGIKVVNFGSSLLNGDRLRAQYYENARHLNPNGGKFIAFRVRERFGFQSESRRPWSAAHNNNRQPTRPNHGPRFFNAPPATNPWKRTETTSYPGLGYTRRPETHFAQRQHQRPGLGLTRRPETHFAQRQHQRPTETRSNAPSHNRPPENRILLLEETLSSFSARLVELFRGS